MVNYRAMSNDEIEFPWLFIGGSASRQARYLAAHEPPIDHDGDTTPLHLPPAPLYDLADDDWPEAEPLDSVDADSADGYTDAYDDGEELP